MPRPSPLSHRTRYERLPAKPTWPALAQTPEEEVAVLEGLIHFEGVPKPVVDLLEDRLDAALQFIAASLLTDRQLAEVYPGESPARRKAWAKELRESLAQEQERLVLELARHQPAMGQGTAENPLRAFDGPVDYAVLSRAYYALEKALLELARGEDARVSTRDTAEWEHQLQAQGYPRHVVTWVMDHGGYARVALPELVLAHSPGAGRSPSIERLPVTHDASPAPVRKAALAEALAFDSVPKPIMDLALSRLDAVLQIVASLTLTKEQLERAYPDQDPDHCWLLAKELRANLLAPGQREVLIDALARQNRGMRVGVAKFPLKALREGPTSYNDLTPAYHALERLLVRYVESGSPQRSAATVARQLTELGFPSADVSWVMANGGHVHLAMADVWRAPNTERPATSVVERMAVSESPGLPAGFDPDRGRKSRADIVMAVLRARDVRVKGVERGPPRPMTRDNLAEAILRDPFWDDIDASVQEDGVVDGILRHGKPSPAIRAGAFQQAQVYIRRIVM